MSQPYDQPFDLFGDTPEPKPGRKQSAKDVDDAINKVYWRRYKIAGIVCWEWINRPAPGQRCGPATWLRLQGPDQRALCSRHKQEYTDAEALGTPRGGQ